MSSVEDYTSGKLLQVTGQALALLKAADDSLAGTETGELLLAEVGKYLELCRSSPQTCICWNTEKRGLKCQHMKL